jgi:hypothetical protein
MNAGVSLTGSFIHEYSAPYFFGIYSLATPLVVLSHIGMPHSNRPTARRGRNRQEITRGGPRLGEEYFLFPSASSEVSPGL